MRKLICIIVGLLTCAITFAQDKSFRKQRLIVSASVGYDFALNTIHMDDIVDHLHGVNTNGFSIPQVRLNWFVKGNFGIEAAFQGLVFKGSKDSYQTVERKLKEDLGTRYYFQPSSLPYYGDDPIARGRLAATLGVIYKIEKGRFAIVPKLVIGAATIGRSGGTYRLKEIDSNTSMDLSYYSDNYANDDVMLWGAAGSFIYRFDSFKGICFNASWLMHKADIDFKRTLINMETQQSIADNYSSNRLMHRLNIGIGFTFSIGKKSERVN